MTHWFMGIKPGVGPVLRVTKNNADDPLTTPSADWGKFIFDSERAHKMGYVANIIEMQASLGPWPAPASGIASYPTADGNVWTTGGGGFYHNQQARVIYPEVYGFSYTPIIESRQYENGTGLFVGGSTVWSQTDSSPQGPSQVGYMQGGVSYLSQYRDSSKQPDGISVLNRRHFSMYGFQGINRDSITSLAPTYVVNQTYLNLTSVWELPAYAVAMPSYASAPVAGQEALRIAPNMVRMAYPGHDINEGAHEAFIFNSSRIPAKIIGAGEVSVGAGGNVKVFTKRPTTRSTYMDFIISESGQPLMHPPPLAYLAPREQRLEMKYNVEADGVRIHNVGDRSFYVRYMILADDNSPNTTGGSKVLQEAVEGGVPFIQLKVPGSSDVAPNLNDIILDTRLPYLPLVAEGWLGAGEFNEPGETGLGTQKKTVWFANDGTWRPFVKYTVTFDDGSVSQPINRVLRVYGLSGSQAAARNGMVSGISTTCRVSNGAAEFFHARGNPFYLTLTSGVTQPSINDIYQPAMAGIRYYIFAIPNSL